jgi:hypothetical protein
MKRSAQKYVRTAMRLATGTRTFRIDTKSARGGGYYAPYVCFVCRKCFKRRAETGLPDKTCPHCGGVAIGLSRNFAAPPFSDKAQWRTVEYLVRSGFRYFPLRSEDTGQRIADPYPRALREAEAFVRRQHRGGF